MKNHKRNCQCGVCKAKRGEYKGKNSPSWKEKIKKVCLTCNKEFKIYPNVSKKGYGKYCSHKCYAESIKNTHISPKTEFKKGMVSWLKDTNIQTNTGKTHFKKGMISWNKGIKMFNISGENHWNWQGGISRNGYPFTFNESLKELIRDRDNRQCQLCGKLEIECNRKLDIHHIDHNKNNLDKDNLISLCNSCHMRVNLNPKLLQLGVL